MDELVISARPILPSAKLLNAIAQLTIDGLYTDGGDHKQWYLERIAKLLGMSVECLPGVERGMAP